VSRAASAPKRRAALPLREALLLGALQGPTELLPISSSVHTTLLPRLRGWRSATLDAELLGALEVALHGGTALALLLDARTLLAAAPQAEPASRGAAPQVEPAAPGATRRRRANATRRARRLTTAALALAPPALAGYVLEVRLRRRPQGPRTLAAGLAAGAAALALADARPATRALADTGPGDGFALGLAQVAALLPGVSRNGATLAAARARGFARGDAQTLSWRAGLPVLFGAAALKGARLLARGVPAGTALALAAGAGAAFLSTLASVPLLLRDAGRARPLLPFALYRLTLAALVLRGTAASPRPAAPRRAFPRAVASRAAPPGGGAQ
jgi:undecaprenyl-diphosphatase